VVLVRLAVCRIAQGRASPALLGDAFEQVLQVREEIGVGGNLVHAAAFAAARRFYRHMGFDPSATGPNTLLLRLLDVEAALKALRVETCPARPGHCSHLQNRCRAAMT